MFMGLTTGMITKFTGAVRPLAASLRPFNRRSAVFLGLVAILGFFTACVAVGVPKTSDPAQKLKYARLLLRDDRPLPAERLIGESIEIYQLRDDRDGLANAQHAYGWFLAGDAVEALEGWYRENGFRDSPADFDSRRQEAVKYFQLAAEGFDQAGNFANAANANFDLGLAQSRIGNRKPACSAFSDSLKNFYAYLRSDPNPEFRVPNGVGSYEEYVILPAAAAGCPMAANLTDRSEDVADDRHDRELALADEALVLARNILGPNHPAITEASKFREHVIRRQRGCFEEKIAPTGVPLDKFGRSPWHELARVYEKKFQFEKAEKNYKKDVSDKRASRHEEHPDTLKSMRHLALFYERRDRYADAAPLAERILELRKKVLGESDPDILESVVDLARIQYRQKNFDGAEPLYIQAVELSQRMLGESDVRTLRRMQELGNFYEMQLRDDEAETIYLQLIELVGTATNKLGYGKYGRDFATNVPFELAAIYDRQGRADDADDMRAKGSDWARALTQAEAAKWSRAVSCNPSADWASALEPN